MSKSEKLLLSIKLQAIKFFYHLLIKTALNQSVYPEELLLPKKNI